LEKNKNLFAQQTFLSAVDTQSFRSDFHAKFCQRFLQNEKGEKLVSKITTKLIKNFNSAI
jgi:hypothetical protein